MLRDSCGRWCWVTVGWFVVVSQFGALVLGHCWGLVLCRGFAVWCCVVACSLVLGHRLGIWCLVTVWAFGVGSRLGSGVGSQLWALMLRHSLGGLCWVAVWGVGVG